MRCPKCGGLAVFAGAEYAEKSKETGYTYSRCSDCDYVFPDPDSYLPPGMR